MEVREVHLHTPLVLHGDGGYAFPGAGHHAPDPGQRGHHLLDGLGDHAFEVLGRDVVVGGDHREPGIRDRRQQVDGEPLVAQDPDQDQCQEHHRNRYGSLNGDP
jgi:hypothetical protein